LSRRSPDQPHVTALGAVRGLADARSDDRYYWAKRLNKVAFGAFQAARRGGEILCRLLGDRVELEGNCVFYLEGRAEI